ncbi:MAG TPA: TlyA family rRNA (cytidine-2'-O)-methyltransferase, partial [Chloroflexia bacterium]|nr:TlyA family rRNA (cytidine-2'-O)-methyltransferase [Chloroflexia bacterium]
VHSDVIIRLAEFWHAHGLHVAGLSRSPITGPAGNVEYLALLEKEQPTQAFDLPAAINREVLAHGR